MVIAHRGGSGLAPENTLAAFRRAVETGSDAIELDVRMTRDSRVVVIHDRRLGRTTNGNGFVGKYTLNEIKSLDAGSWFGAQFEGEPVPTLEEVFDQLPDELPIYVEMKARGPGAWPLAMEVIGIIRRYGRWESTMVAGFNPVALAIVRVMEPRLVRCYISSSRHPLPVRARWLSPLVNPHWYAPDRGTLTSKLLARFHAQGKPVAAWDVDAGSDVRSMRKMGVDAVVTDHPDAFVRQRSDLIGSEHSKATEQNQIMPCRGAG